MILLIFLIVWAIFLITGFIYLMYEENVKSIIFLSIALLFSLGMVLLTFLNPFITEDVLSSKYIEYKTGVITQKEMHRIILLTEKNDKYYYYCNFKKKYFIKRY